MRHRALTQKMQTNINMDSTSIIHVGHFSA